MGEPAALPLPRPQPYRTLKESDSAEGDEAESPEQRARKPTNPAPAPPDRAASIDLLEDVFNNLDMEVPLQPLGQAKSLEDLRTPKDLREQTGTFDYQVCCLQGRGPARAVAVPTGGRYPQGTGKETKGETATFPGSSADAQGHSACKPCQAGQQPGMAVETLLLMEISPSSPCVHRAEVCCRARPPSRDPSPTKSPWRASGSEFLGSGLFAWDTGRPS